MNGNLSSAAVVLHVVSEPECLLTKDRGKFLLLLDLLLVKDSAELVEGILCVTAQSRDILRGILPDVDGAGGNGRRCPAVRIALEGNGDVRNEGLLFNALISAGREEEGWGITVSARS